MDELDKVLAADPEAEAQKLASEAEAKAKAEEEKKQIDPEIQKREEHKANLEKAIAAANEELRRKREEMSCSLYRSISRVTPRC